MFTQICFAFYFLPSLSFTPVGAVSKLNDGVRSKREIIDQASEGKCLAFQLAKGVGGKALQYVCCNNCGKADQSCDGTTYANGSTIHYCDTCGRNTVNSLKLSESFSCDGCYGQTQTMYACKAQYSEVPVACWLFWACFENECEQIEGYSVGLASMDSATVITAQRIVVQ